MRRSLQILFLAMLVVLTACQSPASVPAAGNTTPASNGSAAQLSSASQAAPVPTSQPDKATVTGSVFSTRTNAPLRKDTPIWFAQVYRNDKGDAAYALDPGHSPAFNVNNDGVFVGPNLSPHEYVIVIGDPYSKYEVISEGGGKARVWDIKAGSVVDVGKLQVDVE